MRRSTLRVIQGGRPASRMPCPDTRTLRPKVPDSPAGVRDRPVALGLPSEVCAQMEAIFGPDSAGRGTDDPAEFMATVGRHLLGRV